jgi:hypothetical protein
LKASIVAVAQRAARASEAAPAGQALAAVGEGLGGAAAAVPEVAAAEDDEDRLFPWPAVRFRVGKMEHWNDRINEITVFRSSIVLA